MYSLKLELKLNNKQETFFTQCAGFNRFVYNYGLSIYNQLDHNIFKGSSTKKLDLIRKIFTNHTKKQPEFQWCNDYSSRIYQHAFINLKTAFTRFFKGISSYPKFKRKSNDCSFTVDNANGKQLLPKGNKIKLPTLGTFRLKEKLKFDCISQSFTISKEGGKWFVSFSIDAERISPRTQTIWNPIGIDLGINTYATLSDGTTIENPKPYTKAKTKLKAFQYRNRNKQFGNRNKNIKASNNAKKYFLKLNKFHKRISNVRKDFLHKLTSFLVKKYHHLRIENLNVKGMLSNRKLSSSISDLGAYEFKRILSYKSEWYGTILDTISQWFPSSKGCHNCGHLKPELTLKDRIFNCNNCGLIMDRDLNAALRLEKAPESEIVSKILPLKLEIV